VISCPTLKGCVSQGETEEEALENIKDAIQTYLASIQDLKRINKLKTVEVPAARRTCLKSLMSGLLGR